jgi:hypothetical protein
MSTGGSPNIDSDDLASTDTQELLDAIRGNRTLVASPPAVPPSNVQFTPRTAFTNRTARAQPPPAPPAQPPSYQAPPPLLPEDCR